MTEQHLYTIGELAKKGMLKTWDGRPILDKSHVSRIVNGLDYVKFSTPWGQGKGITKQQVDDYNNKHIMVEH